jgi:membrane protease YdiL (CAAX protease family)
VRRRSVTASTLQRRGAAVVFREEDLVIVPTADLGSTARPTTAPAPRRTFDVSAKPSRLREPPLSTTLVSSPTTAARASTGRTVVIPQLGLGRILATWAAAAVPMGLIAWVIAPRVADHLSGPAPLAQALLVGLTAGLVWQALLVAGLVFAEQRTLRFSVVRQALWLQAPTSPRTGRKGGRLWLLTIPLILLFGAEAGLPTPSHPAGRDLGLVLDTPAGHALFHGSWGWYAVVLVLGLFNTVLGEELLFRGYLLPRMQRTFGRADWLANGILFALYHVHVPWAIPATFADAFIVAYPAKRFRSALFSIAVHSVQSVFFFALTLKLVLS